jgi:hypothetical protein
VLRLLGGQVEGLRDLTLGTEQGDGEDPRRRPDGHGDESGICVAPLT